MTDRILVIHPGMAKAGSTALQRGLSQHREPLLRDRIWYPQGPTNRHAHHYLFDHGSIFKTTSSPNFDVSDLWQKLAATADQLNAKYTLVSSEVAFARCMDDGYLKRLSECLGGWTQVRIAIVLRHQIDFIESAFGESLRSPDWQHVLSPKTVIGTARSTLMRMAENSRVGSFRVEPNYARQIAAFQTALPDALMITLDYQTIRESAQAIAPTFLRASGLPVSGDLEGAKNNTRQNVSISPMGMIVAQRLGTKLQPEIEKIIETEVLNLYPEAAGSTIFTRRELAELKEHFDLLNQELPDVYNRTGFPNLRSRYHLKAPKIYREDLTERDFQELVSVVRNKLG